MLVRVITNEDTCERGFSLLEILLVIALIAIISGLLIPEILGMRNQAQLVTARQQQAELQTALGNWIVAKSGDTGGLAGARAVYSSHSGNKLQLLQNYLQAGTYAALVGNGDNVTSSALTGAKAYLRFSTWSAGGEQPNMEWINQ
jgi:prepilin-type N-terminal cleavage/methylation domain-containing protein